MGFSGPKKPVPSDEISNANEHNMVKDSTGRRLAIYMCIYMCRRGLKQGSIEKQSINQSIFNDGDTK